MAEQDIHNEELPLEGAASRLRRARESAGLSLGDVAARTKIAERHLNSIENGRFGDLASRTYAVGFARAYARTVGLDEAEIARSVREELAADDKQRETQQVDVFEPGDPARVPGSRLAWVAALGAVVVIALVFVFWRSFFSPAVSLPELAAEREAAPTAPPVARATPSRPAAPGGPVVFTALEPNVWVKFYDAQGDQLMQKQMTLGESYTVPADADGPLIRTARPDALRISVGGRVVPKLADAPVNLKDVPVSAAALLARSSPAPAAVDTARQPAASQPTTAASPVTRQTTAVRPGANPIPEVEERAAAPLPAPQVAPSPAPAPPPVEGETSTVSN